MPDPGNVINTVIAFLSFPIGNTIIFFINNHGECSRWHHMVDESVLKKKKTFRITL